jgi:hypothetical protein
MKTELLELSNKIVSAVFEANRRFIAKSKATGKKIVVSKDGEILEIDYSENNS